MRGRKAEVFKEVSQSRRETRTTEAHPLNGPSTDFPSRLWHVPHYLRLLESRELIGGISTGVHQGSLHAASAIYTYRPFFCEQRTRPGKPLVLFPTLSPVPALACELRRCHAVGFSTTVIKVRRVWLSSSHLQCCRRGSRLGEVLLFGRQRSFPLPPIRLAPQSMTQMLLFRSPLFAASLFTGHAMSITTGNKELTET